MNFLNSQKLKALNEVKANDERLQMLKEDEIQSEL